MYDEVHWFEEAKIPFENLSSQYDHPTLEIASNIVNNLLMHCVKQILQPFLWQEYLQTSKQEHHI